MEVSWSVASPLVSSTVDWRLLCCFWNNFSKTNVRTRCQISAMRKRKCEINVCETDGINTVVTAVFECFHSHKTSDQKLCWKYKTQHFDFPFHLYQFWVYRKESLLPLNSLPSCPSPVCNWLRPLPPLFKPVSSTVPTSLLERPGLICGIKRAEP